MGRGSPRVTFYPHVKTQCFHNVEIPGHDYLFNIKYFGITG
jgi:hypothetical protein